MKEIELCRGKSYSMREGRKKCIKTFVEISDGSLSFD